MELIINANGTVTITNATKMELVKFAEFVNGSPIPYNTVTETRDIVVEVDTPTVVETTEEVIENNVEATERRMVKAQEIANVIGRSLSTTKFHLQNGGFDSENGLYDLDACLAYITPKLNQKLSNVMKSVHENSKKAKIEKVNTDEYNITIPQLVKKYNSYHQLFELRTEKNHIPFVKKGNTRYFREADWEKEFEVHPVQSKMSHKRNTTLKIVSNYDMWRKEQSAKVRMSGKDIGKTFSSVYRELTKVYGISWDQVAKDYKYAKGHSHRATIELVYFLQYEQEHEKNEHYEHLFENELDKICA